MAKSFALVPVRQIKQAASVLPIAICTPIPPSAQPSTIPFRIDWSDYGASSVNPVAINIDLQASNVVMQKLDKIRSVYIDNSFSFTPIFVYFPDTQFTVICPANSIVMAPVFSHVPTRAIVYAEEFVDALIPLTTVHFSNVPQDGFVVSTGEFTPPSFDPAIILADTSQRTTSSTTQTFSNQVLGDVDADRIIIVAIHWLDSNATTTTLNALTCGGNAMTILDQQRRTIESGNVGVALAALAVPTGETASIVGTFSTNVDECSIEVYAGYNMDSATPFDIEKDTDGGVSTLSLNIDTPNPGIMVCGVSTYGANPANISGVENVGNYTVTFLGSRYGYQQTDSTGLTPLTTVSGYTSRSVIIGASFS